MAHRMKIKGWEKLLGMKKIKFVIKDDIEDPSWIYKEFGLDKHGREPRQKR